MFSKAVGTSFLLLGLLGVILWATFGRVRAEDVAHMRALFTEKNWIKSGKALSTSEQHRLGVVKDLFVVQDNAERLHHRICSEHSTLTLVPQGHRIELIEKLEHLRCTMQDKLIPSSSPAGRMQQVRFLEADEGFYFSSSRTFSAHAVHLSLYRLGGHQLPEALPPLAPFLKGIAKEVSFSLSGRSPELKAEGLRAEFARQEEMIP